MKTRIILLLLLTFNVNNIFSQEAPVLKFTDIFGNFYMSSDIIAQNKYIFIDFFSSGCPSCHDIAPFIDTLHMDFGCNCGDIFFAAMNTYTNSTDEEVFAFTQNYHINFPAVSGEGNSGNVTDLLEIPWSPYFILINPANQIIIDTSYFAAQYQEIRDTLLSFGITPQICEGTDLKYYELRTDSDTFPSNIDYENKLITIVVPTGVNLTNTTPFFIKSSNSNAYIDGDLQISDESVVDFSDSLVTYSLVAESYTITTDWTIKIIEQTTSLDDNTLKPIIYPNPSNGLFYLSNYKDIDRISIYSSKGNLISTLIPSSNEQNFSILPNDIYIVLINTKGKIISQKLIIK